MYNKLKEKIIYLFIVVVIIMCSTVSNNYAQSQDTTYSISTYIGLGYSGFISELDYKNLNKSGFSGTVRIMWEPDNLLSVGVESGYLQLYRLNDQRINVPHESYTVSSELNTVPLLAIFSMKIFNDFKLSVGTGVFLLMSNVDALGNAVTSTQISTGSYGAALYLFPLSETISLGSEIKYYFINKIEDGDLTVQLSLQYKFLVY